MKNKRSVWRFSSAPHCDPENLLSGKKVGQNQFSPFLYYGVVNVRVRRVSLFLVVDQWRRSFDCEIRNCPQRLGSDTEWRNSHLSLSIVKLLQHYRVFTPIHIFIFILFFLVVLTVLVFIYFLTLVKV